METPRKKLDCQVAFALSEDPRWKAQVVWERVQSVYATHVGGDSLYEADVEDAAVFVGSFTWAAMMRRDYAAAERELRRFFRHPDIEQVEFREEFECRLAFCALGQGREMEALAAFRALLLNDNPRERHLTACFIRNHLVGHGLCPVLAREGLASEAMTGFVEELAACILNRPPDRKRFPRRTTNRNLARHLYKTFPPPRVDDPLDRLIAEKVEEFKRTYRPPKLNQ